MFDGFLQELKPLAQFVVHKGKHPFTPSTGRPAKAGHPETWETFEAAVAVLEASPGAYDGLGFEFNNNGVVGVDLDHVRDPETGKVTPEAEAIVELLNSYTEISPSGTGLHIYVRGTIPEDGRKDTKRGIEMYQAGRFFTVTGNVYEGGK